MKRSQQSHLDLKKTEKISNNYCFCNYVPAVPGIVIKFRENSKSAGKSVELVKISTHNSKDPISSSIRVKILSNPTRIAKSTRYYKQCEIRYKIYTNLPSLSTISTSDESGMIRTGTVEPSARDKVRLNLSVSSRAPSSMIVTLKHCL